MLISAAQPPSARDILGKAILPPTVFKFALPVASTKSKLPTSLVPETSNLPSISPLAIVGALPAPKGRLPNSTPAVVTSDVQVPLA